MDIERDTQRESQRERSSSTVFTVREREREICSRVRLEFGILVKNRSLHFSFLGRKRRTLVGFERERDKGACS